MSQLRFLIDANLPGRMPFWSGSAFSLVLDRTWSDLVIWRYAVAEGIDVIVSRDADFEQLVRKFSTPPKVVKLQLGRRNRAGIREFLLPLWPEVEAHCQQSEVHLVVVRSDGRIVPTALLPA